jgi:hypothetical protein
MKAGMVLTVEPGIYFIPALIAAWQAEGRHSQYINYARFADMTGFGGIRIEDNVLVTETGSRVLGEPIPNRGRAGSHHADVSCFAIASAKKPPSRRFFHSRSRWEGCELLGRQAFSFVSSLFFFLLVAMVNAVHVVGRCSIACGCVAAAARQATLICSLGLHDGLASGKSCLE